MSSRTTIGPLRLAACLLAAGLSACSGSPAGVRTIVLVTLDTTRADALGCYSGRDGITPRLDRLAEQSVRYLAARTVAPLTLPAHASMLTGLTPVRHTLRENGLAALPSSADTLAERLHERGWQTGAFVAAAVLDSTFGLDQGFEVYDQPERVVVTGSSFAERPATEVVAAAEAWLAARDPERPLFLWLHLFEPHFPYEPPAAFQSQAAGDAYLGEVGAADAAVGRLFDALAALGLYHDALIAVVADHGEGRLQHLEETHGTLCYDSTLRVPLLLRYPDGHRAGEASDEVVSVVDVFPTLLEGAGQSAPAEVDGRSLFHREVPAGRGVYFETYSGYLQFGWSPLVGWADDRVKYIHSSEPELYRIDVDPAETENVIASASGQDRARMREAIERFVDREALASTGAEGSPDQELLERIESLGYALGGAQTGELPPPLAAHEGPSPASRREEMNEINLARASLDRGEYAAAATAFERILRGNPGNVAVMNYLSSALARLGRVDEAAALLRRAIERGADRPLTRLGLSACLRLQGDLEGALAEVMRALELDPHNLLGLNNAVALLNELGRSQEASPFLERLRALRAVDKQ